MDPKRQHVLADFLAKQLATTPKALLPLAILGAVVSAVGLIVITLVLVGGAAGFDEVGAPLAVLGVATAASVAGCFLIAKRIRSLPNHPLVVAVRSQPGEIARVVPTLLRGGPAGQRPALNFVLRSGDEHLVIMSEKSRAEFITWLAREGAQVG